MEEESLGTMATPTREIETRELDLGHRLAGVVAGITAAWFMGLHMWAMNSGVLDAAIPGLYGLSGPLAGWIVHLGHGAVLGLGFAAVVESDVVTVDTWGRCIALAVAWGVLLWVVLAAVLMPVWLQAVGFANAPSLPNFAPPSLFWHALFGLALGVVYPLAR